MNIHRISTMNCVQKNNYKQTKTQNNYGATDIITFGAKMPALPDIETLLKKVPQIKKEAEEIIKEAAVLTQRIKAGKISGINIAGDFVYVLDAPTSTNSSRRFCFLNRKHLTDFWKHDPVTQSLKSSCCFDPLNSSLITHTEYHENPRMEDIFVFDNSDNVSHIAQYDPEKRTGLRTEIFDETTIGETTMYEERFNLIPMG